MTQSVQAQTGAPIWLASYPSGVSADVDVSQYRSLVALIDESTQRYAQRTAYSFMGTDISYARFGALSRAFAAYLQSLGLARGDRVAIMMPNVPQYPVAVAAILQAGYVVVNINPLYTARELALQLQDSGARAIVIIENFATTLQQCLPTTQVQHIVLCSLGDQLGWLHGRVVNAVVRHVKKMVPPFALPGAVRFNTAIASGQDLPFSAPEVGPEDIAVLQYTGGTTGVSKGAVLLHRNLVANVLQSEAWNAPAVLKIPAGVQPVGVCALPLYHIFAFTISMMLMLRMGGKTVLIVNPRDIAAVLKDMSRHTVHIFPGVNTLFNAMLRHPDFRKVEWRHLVVALGAGTAVVSEVAKAWFEATGCPICEGYGLTETSPSAICNPVTATAYSGGIGFPIPQTEVLLLDDQDVPVAIGERGEIAIRGPQLMAGYWNRPDETARCLTASGYFRTGDVGTMDARGFFKVVDRKKDMILVSGFNVYPNEIEDVLSHLPGVQECACVGIADARTGEAVKLVIVRADPALQEDAVRRYCQENLTAYKHPRVIEFRLELPKTPVGKVLRRALRD